MDVTQSATALTEKSDRPVVSSCCSTDLDADVQPCPRCGATGPVIGPEPVQPHRPNATHGSWQHCATVECPVVYYLRDEVVAASELITQVAHKGLDKPTPVCFCFSHTPDDLAANLADNDGTSTIKLAIKTAVADGFCACEHLNPSEKCCLADIHRALKAIGTTSAPVLAM